MTRNKAEKIQAKIIEKKTLRTETDLDGQQKITEQYSRELQIPTVEGYTDIKVANRSFFNNGNFVTVFQNVLKSIAMYSKLSKHESNLLLYLIGSCAVDNSVCIDLNVLSEDLHIDKGNVSRALKGLVERNIVLRKDGYRYGNAPLPMSLSLNYDQINYNLAYNGKIKTFPQNRNKHPLITESDGRTLLEDHSDGQPYHVMQDNGKYLTISSDGEILPPKKKRGRPRKDPDNTIVQEISEQTQTSCEIIK